MDNIFVLLCTDQQLKFLRQRFLERRFFAKEHVQGFERSHNQIILRRRAGEDLRNCDVFRIVERRKTVSRLYTVIGHLPLHFYFHPMIFTGAAESQPSYEADVKNRQRGKLRLADREVQFVSHQLNISRNSLPNHAFVTMKSIIQVEYSMNRHAVSEPWDDSDAVATGDIT